MVTVYCAGDTTPTGAEVLRNGTTDVTVTCDEYNESVSYTYTLYNYTFEFDYAAYIAEEHIKAVRGGWNNPRKIQLPNKPFFSNPQNVIRNALPRKIRQIDYVA